MLCELNPRRALGRNHLASGVVALIVVLCLSACGGGSGKAEPAAETGPQVSLKPAASNAELESFLKDGFRSASEGAFNGSGQVVDSEAGGDAGLGSAADQFSRTNTQVDGVDEADYWKFNGKHFYYTDVSAGKVRVLAPGEPAQPLGEISGEYTAEGLYVSDDTLIALHGAGSARAYWGFGYFGSDYKTRVTVFDISAVSTDAAAAIERLDIEIEGALMASRRIGDDLYLVSRHMAELAGWIDYPETQAELDSNDALLESARLEDFLPRITVNGVTKDLLADSGCYLVQESEQGYPVLTSITRINSRSGEFTNGCIAGPVSGLYMSTDNAYLFNNTLHYANDVMTTANWVNLPEEQTHIHKFKLDSALSYVASNVVAGHNACKVASYCFGELAGGELALVTTYGWGEEIEHSLTTLAADDLRVLGQLPDEAAPELIGKPGEELYAARFMQDRAYLVTFAKVDPLYVLDLTDPAEPSRLGELEIPGFSDYLHPINDNLLLGIGKSAVTGSSGITWYQGLKVDLFDVADLANPAQIASFDLGKRGSNTAVAYDPHAFTYAWKEDQFRFLLPVSISDGATGDAVDGDPASTYYPWQYSGFQSFEVDVVAGGTARMYALPATVIASTETQNPYGWGYGDRATLIGDATYMLFSSKVYRSDWQATADVTEVAP